MIRSSCYALTLLVALATGCSSPPEKTLADSVIRDDNSIPREPNTEKGFKPLLPDGATNLRAVGSGWFTFDWEKRSFLFARYITSRGYTVGTITEISSCPR